MGCFYLTDEKFREVIRSSFQEIVLNTIYETIFSQKEESFLLDSFCELSDLNKNEVDNFINKTIDNSGRNYKEITILERMEMMKSFEKEYPKIFELIEINAKEEVFEKFKKIVGE